MTERLYRIFISSPSDVRPERAIAQRVVAKLAREFAHHCQVEPILWEREPLVATHHFQDLQNIPPPSTADICVVVLWSSMGFPLPADRFRGAMSGRAVTGTEWEFEDAVKGFQERGLPDLLLYQKTAEITASIADEAAFEELRRQRGLVSDFLGRWLRSSDGASFIAASHVFATTADFEDKLEEHLRALLRRHIEKDLGLGAELGSITWNDAPWRALQSFDVAQAAIFFGRTRARNEVRERLAGQIEAGTAFIAVIGATGSGKSSLVKAGLLPDLMLPGMLGDVGMLRYAIMRPSDGADTLSALAQAILSPTALPELSELQYDPDALKAQLRENPGQAAFAVKQGLVRAAAGKLTTLGQARLAIVVDQLEELFTIERITLPQSELFIRALLALARSGLVWVITTLRADFFDRIEQLPELAGLSEGARYFLRPPNLTELMQIIGKPARAGGLHFEIDSATGEGLDGVILGAASRDPGALPLLSFALDRLWRQPRDGTILTFSAYAELGELEGAIANHAESVVAALPPAAQTALPALLLGLVALREGEQQATARPGRRRDVAVDAAASLVLDRLLEARLLVADDTPQGIMIRLAHEALLRNWPRLANLIEESREALAAISRLRGDLSLWERKGRAADLLIPNGKRLLEGIELVERGRYDLGVELAAYIRHSAIVAGAAARRRRRQALGALLVLSMLTLTAGAGAWFGLSGRYAAEASRAALQKQFDIAQSRRAQNLALALKGEPYPGVVEAVALSILPHQGDARAPNRELLDRLLVAANGNRQRAVLSADNKLVFTADFSPDGARIVTASEDRTARIWNADTGAPIATLAGHQRSVTSAHYSSDGRRIATSSLDRTVRIWDAASGKVLLVIGGPKAAMSSAVFSADGSRLLAGCRDSSAYAWNAATGALLATFAGHGGAVLDAAFSPDGRRVVTASADKTARIWDAGSGRLLVTLAGHEGRVDSAAFSPDGRNVVTASHDKTARVWDAASGALLMTLKGHDSFVWMAAYSPDGRRIVTASADKTLRIWEAATGTALAILPGHEDWVDSAAFSADGRSIVSGSYDGTARRWDVTRGMMLGVLRGHADRVDDAEFSPDGRRIVTASVDDTARVWDAASFGLIRTLTGHTNFVFSASFNADGTRLLTGSNDRTARIWDAESGALLTVMAGHKDGLTNAAFSPDGRLVATASRDGTARVWDARTGAPLLTLAGHRDEVSSANFSPDGKRIVTTSSDATARIWDAVSGSSLLTLTGHAGIVGFAAYSPDGLRIATASTDKTARIWDALTGASIAVLSGHDDFVSGVAFSPDGRNVVTAAADGIARVWDAASGTLLALLDGHAGGVESAVYSRDGGRIVTASDDHTAQVWDTQDYLRPDDLAFIRATASRAADTALRARYALPAAAGIAGAPHACGAPALEAARRGDGVCHAKLAAGYDGTRSTWGKAFFHHALAARLLEAQGLADAAQTERYRREALAWQLPRGTVERLMVAADKWAPGDGFPP